MAPYVTQPLGEGQQVRTHELIYQAARWTRPCRVVLVALKRMKEQGELFLDYFFLLTNASVAEAPAEVLLERYRKRGETEKDFGEWKQTPAVSLSSSPRPRTTAAAGRCRRLAPGQTASPPTRCACC